MTRETKIGLLVGLGFIVVFAVLLSHNGAGPTSTQLPPIAQNPTDSVQPGRSPLTQSPVGLADAGSSELPSTPPPMPAGPELIDPIDGLAVDTGDELPAPMVFNQSDMLAQGPSSFEASPAGERSTAGRSLEDAVAMVRTPAINTPELSLESSRVVPPVVDPPRPEPVARAVIPEASPDPDAVDDSAGPALAGGPARAGASVETVVLAPPKPYVVQKGDTLVKITREIYNNSSPKVIDFVVEANKGNIKDRHSLREGQKIVTPPLPADMFEQRTLSVGRDRSDLRQVQHLIDEISVPRRAPEGQADGSAAQPATGAGNMGRPSLPLGQHSGFIPVTVDKPGTSAAEREDKPAPPDRSTPPGIRLYEVQPKDTFSSIAQRELGSSNRWVEIKQMNKDVNPLKIRPGMKIRLPARDSMSSDGSDDRAAA